MKIKYLKEIVGSLSSYYNFARLVGNTHLLITAINEFDGNVIVLVPSIALYNHEIRPKLKNSEKVIPIDVFSENFVERLTGFNYPILFDNSTLTILFDELNSKLKLIDEDKE